jgi:hydrogenase/urease accessory protein HupE
MYYQYKGTIASLRGQVLHIKYPKFNPAITSFIQLNDTDKKGETIVLGPEKQKFVIPLETTLLAVVKQYTLLGLNHIWSGFDHLLFVACLVFIAGFSKKLVYAITGFTIAHSITLFLAALNITNLPLPPVEACIALSILFLCYEIIHHHKDKTSLTYRFPIAVSSSFGLLHGFGFAGVLSEIGLPYESKIVGLLFFNIGVEIGQLLFIGLLLLLVLTIVKLPHTKLKQTFLLKSYKIGVYVVGILASYWLFERLLST